MTGRAQTVLAVACILAVLCAGLVAGPVTVAIIVSPFEIVPVAPRAAASAPPSPEASAKGGVLAVHPHRGPPSA